MRERAAKHDGRSTSSRTSTASDGCGPGADRRLRLSRSGVGASADRARLARARDQPRRGGAEAIEAAGIEAVDRRPDRIGTVLDTIEGVTLIFWLLGSPSGDAERVAALHGAAARAVARGDRRHPGARRSSTSSAGGARAGSRAAGARSSCARPASAGGSRSRSSTRDPARPRALARGDARRRAQRWSAEPSTDGYWQPGRAAAVASVRPRSLVGDRLRRLVELVGEQDLKPTTQRRRRRRRRSPYRLAWRARLAP